MDLSTSLENVKGVGEKTALQLEAAGLRTVEDLIFFFPYRYEDFSEITLASNVRPGKITLKATVEDLRTKQVRRGMHIIEATLADSSHLWR